MIKGDVAVNDRVMVSDGEDKWFTGEVANIEGKCVTVSFYNPNSGDGWIDIYDADDKNVVIIVIEKFAEVAE